MKLNENFSAALKDVIPKEEAPGEELDLEKDVRTMMQWIKFSDCMDRDSPVEERSYDEIPWA
jgi:hypothetical protein